MSKYLTCVPNVRGTERSKARHLCLYYCVSYRSCHIEALSGWPSFVTDVYSWLLCYLHVLSVLRTLVFPIPDFYGARSRIICCMFWWFLSKGLGFGEFGDCFLLRSYVDAVMTTTSSVKFTFCMSVSAVRAPPASPCLPRKNDAMYALASFLQEWRPVCCISLSWGLWGVGDSAAERPRHSVHDIASRSAQDGPIDLGSPHAACLAGHCSKKHGEVAQKFHCNIRFLLSDFCNMV